MRETGENFIYKECPAFEDSIMTTLRLALSAVLLFLFLPAGGQAQEHRKIMAPRTIQSDLLGLVSRIQEFSQTGNAAKEQTGEMTFNPAGDLLEEKDFENGKLTGSTLYHYDPASGTLLSSEELDGNGKMLHISHYNFEVPERKMIKTTGITEGKATEVDTTIYNDKGLESESRTEDGDGKLMETYAAQRNFDGKEIDVQFGGPDGKPATGIQIQWDPKGYELSETISLLSGKDRGKTRIEYSEVKLDAKGNWIERKRVSTVKMKGEKAEPETSRETRVIEYFPK